MNEDIEQNVEEKVIEIKDELFKKNSKKSMIFLIPSLIGVLIFFILPFFIVIYYSFIDNPINKEFVFLDNFISVFKNASFQKAASNTAIFSLISVPLVTVFSLILAMILNYKIPFKTQFRTIFLCPIMVPIASVVLIWQVLFHYHGSLNSFTASFGIAPIDWLKSEGSLVVIVIMFMWKNLGYNMILFLAAINNIPREIIEVADIEGASPFYIFIHLKLRYLSPTILFVTTLSLINSFKIFREVYLLTGEYPFDSLYMLQHFMNNTFGTLDYQKLSSAAIIMAIVVVAVIAALFIFENKYGEDVE